MWDDDASVLRVAIHLGSRSPLYLLCTAAISAVICLCCRSTVTGDLFRGWSLVFLWMTPELRRNRQSIAVATD